MKPKKPNAPSKTRLPHETKGETKSARCMKGEPGEKAGGRIDRRRPAKKTHARSGNLPLSLLLPQRIEDPLGGCGFRPRSPLPLSLAEATDRAAVRPFPGWTVISVYQRRNARLSAHFAACRISALPGSRAVYSQYVAALRRHGRDCPVSLMTGVPAAAGNRFQTFRPSPTIRRAAILAPGEPPRLPPRPVAIP